MMSEETEEQLEERLCKVVAQADTTFFERYYVWTPLGPGAFPSADALACVCDGREWFQFAPSRSDESTGRFRVVCFRFSEHGPGAIGFVGWLHSHLRRMGKTGAIVICGKDRRNSPQLFQICQGVMDYWACPVGSAGDRFIEVIRTLIERGKSHG
jgi:hypothetical protein